MTDILIAAAIVTGIGLLCGILLAVAAKVMAVKVDETVGKLRDALPGANCGACGYTGCDGYAEALAKGEAKTIKVYGSDRTVEYDPQKRIGIAISRMGASQAICMGAYSFALSELDK